jgi:DNA-binding response OmpR family regulator
LTKLLLVEDDRRITNFLRRGLEAEGYGVDTADNGEDGLELCRSNDYALVILDRMLPGLDGMEVCRALRRERGDCLVLMLTARDALQDKIDGLQAGADDYLTKPFAFDELLARLRALLRRGQPRGEGREEHPMLQVGDLLLDTARRRARRGDREIVLTVREFALLAYLMEHAGTVLSRSRILSRVWSYSFDPESKVVEVYIRQLRQKIDEGEATPMIKTVRGFGYTISPG